MAKGEMAMKSLSRISRKVSSKKKAAPTLPHLEVKPREDRSVDLSPNAHMREILKDNVLCWFFKAFLNKQYCSEILSCWLEVEGFRYLETSVELGNKATYIFQQYIASGMALPSAAHPSRLPASALKEHTSYISG